jgi:hypothetical protein
LQPLITSKSAPSDIADNTEIGYRDKILALRLAAETEVSTARLLAEGPGVLALNDIQERLSRIENYKFQEKLRGQLQIAR